jgi:hypothetical protein
VKPHEQSSPIPKKMNGFEVVDVEIETEDYLLALAQLTESISILLKSKRLKSYI